MKFIQEIEPKVYLLKIFVKPNSKKQEIHSNSFEDEFLTIFLRSKPIQNKANRELLSFLRKRLRDQLISIEIVNGTKSPNKIIRLVLKNIISKQKIFDLLQ